MEKQKKKQNGITLIALVISIIVMLILAGVSLNMTVGDNGIISRAQEATMLQSVAELQDFFDQYYVQNFDELNENITKVEAVKSKNSNWFYYTVDGYIVDDEGHAMYLIVKSNLLRDNPNLNIKGGDAGEGTYRDYASLNDVYGVTKDLKVYYCASGTESILGVVEEDLDLEDMSRTVMSNSNPLAKLIPHEEGKDLTVHDLRNIDTLTITADSDVSNLNDLYRLSSLTSLTIQSKKERELDLTGLKNAYKLTYLCFYDCDLEDYSSLSALTNLKYLYLYKSCDDEVRKVFTAMKDVDYLKLNYLGVFGVTLDTKANNWWTNASTTVSEVTDISSIALLSSRTKSAVSYLLLHNNKITSISALSGFSTVSVLTLQRNNLTSLTGLENITTIKTLGLQYNTSLSNISAISKSNLSGICLNNTAITNVNALAASSGKSLWLQNISTLTDISQIANFSSCGALYLSGCGNLTNTSVGSIRYVWNNTSKEYRNINSNYLEYLEVEDTKNYSGKGYTDAQLADYILNKPEILRLNLASNTSLGNTAFSTLSTTTQKAITDALGDTASSKTNDAYLRYILSTCTGMKYLSLNGLSKLSNIDFIKYMPNLVEIDLRGTSVTDLSIMDTLKKGTGTNKLTSLGFIAVDNVNTDFTKFQTTIESLNGKGGAYWATYGDRNRGGLGIGNAGCFSTLNKGLNYCTSIKTLSLKVMGPTTSTYFDLSGMSSLETYRGYTVNAVIKLPASVKDVYGEHMQHPFFATSSTSPAQLTSYNNNNSNEDTPAALAQMFQSLQYCQTTKEVSFSMHSICGGENLDGIGYLKNMKISSFYFQPWYYNLSNFTPLTELNLSENETTTGYIRTLQIEGSRSVSNANNIIKSLPNLSTAKISKLILSNFGIEDISGIKDNSYVIELNFSNNKIRDLSPLSGLKQLQRLTLNSNNLYNTYLNTATNETIYNLDVLYRLNHSITSTNNLTYVNVSANHFEETNEYTKVKNSFGSDSVW